MSSLLPSLFLYFTSEVVRANLEFLIVRDDYWEHLRYYGHRCYWRWSVRIRYLVHVCYVRQPITFRRVLR